jgi:hypothetical protein
MPDDFQYVKMPDGSYGKFRADASDDVIRQAVIKDFPNAYNKAKIPTESEAFANPPQAPPFNKIKTAGGTFNNPLTDKTPPALASPVAPLGAAASIPRAIGGLTGAYAGQKLTGQFTDNQWAKDAVSLVLGMLGSGVATQAEEIMPAVKRASLETPEKINLPGGFKINRNVPPDPKDVVYSQVKELTEAQEQAMSENAKFDRAAAVKQARLEKQTQAARDDLDSAYTERGKSIMMQQAYQDKLDAAQTKAENALVRSQRDAQMRQGEDMSAEIENNKNLSKAATEAAQENMKRTSISKQAEDARIQRLHDQFSKSLEELQSHRMQTLTDRAKLNEQWASALNKRGGTPVNDKAGAVENPIENETPFGMTKDLISRTLKLSVSGEQPTAEDLKRAGDLTQVPIENLKALAKWGDRLAQIELRRRLQGSIGLSKLISK